jgi:hypothetical protein
MNLRRASWIGFACIATVLTGCAGPAAQVRVDKSQTDFAQCRTFDWLPTSNEAVSFTEQRVRAEAIAALQSKGYTQTSDKPDCRITYVLSTHEQPRSKPSVGVGAGGGSGGLGGGIGVSIPIGRKDRQVGTFTLDVVDANRNEQIWSGSVDASFAAAELTADEAKSVVNKVLSAFPDRK